MSEVPPAELAEDFSVQDEVPIELRRMENPGQQPVLLLHGASAQHETFLVPRNNDGCLAAFLWNAGYDVWLLDWRGSCRVAKALEESGKLEDKRHLLDLDHAAAVDLPSAVKKIQETCHGETEITPRVDVVGHCLGAGTLAQAIASGDLKAEHLKQVVLLTLGLFYQPPVDGKLKNIFRVLEDLWNEGTACVVDPRRPSDDTTWPLAIRSFYDRFGARLGPHPLQARFPSGQTGFARLKHSDLESRSAHALCNRLSFMYGTPYLEANLSDEIHGQTRIGFKEGESEPRIGERLRAERVGGEVEAVGFVSRVEVTKGSWGVENARAEGTIDLTGAVDQFPNGATLKADDREIAVCAQAGATPILRAELDKQFGAIPLRMYLQGARNVRRTWAASFDGDKHDLRLIGQTARQRFGSLAAVTLITGNENRLWHRKSIGEMYQWLRRGPTKPPDKVHMKVLAGYGHQDLLWGKNAKSDVFPYLLKNGLGGPGKPIEAASPFRTSSA